MPVRACAYRCFLASFSCYAATKYAGGVRCGASREVRITDNFPTIDIVVKTAHAKKVPEDRLSTTTSGSTTSMTWVTEVRRRCSPGHFAQHSLILCYLLCYRCFRSSFFHFFVLVPTLSLSLSHSASLSLALLSVGLLLRLFACRSLQEGSSKRNAPQIS